MKRLIPTLATIAFLIYPSVCLPSYLIELKNGRRFITNQYWEEGGEIRFSLYGGVVGIRKDDVKGIRESDVAYEEEVVYPEIPGKEILDKKDKSDKSLVQKDASKNLEEISKQAHRESEIKRITEKSKKAWDRYEEASEHGSKAERDEARKKALEIDRKLKELTRESSDQPRVRPPASGE